jgi:lipid-A-disaccharide synthase
MKGIIDKMLVVFPFETEIYRRHGIDVEFVGHPLLEVLGEPQGKVEFCKRHGLAPDTPIVGLFPGSRRQELERIFPTMLGAARLLHQKLGVQIAVGASSLLEFEFVKSFLRDDFPVRLLQHATHDLMKNADVALVTSGTATLETAFYRTPMVIVYKTSMLTYLIGRLVVRIDTIGLANIVAGKRIVPELIQGAATPERLAAEAMTMLSDPELRKTISRDLGAVREHLGTAGASGRVAQALLSVA